MFGLSVKLLHIKMLLFQITLILTFAAFIAQTMILPVHVETQLRDPENPVNGKVVLC